MKTRKLNIILFNLLRSFAPPLFNFVIAILGIQYFGAEEWGELVSIMIMLFLFSFVGNWGNQEYLIREYSKSPSAVSELFLSGIWTRSLLLLLSLCLFFIYSPAVALSGIGLIVLQFIYNSFGSIVVFYQKFKAQLWAEILGFAIILTAIFFIKTFNVLTFLWVYATAFIAKIILLLSVFKPFSGSRQINFRKSHITLALPFFLIGFVGWLHSKISLYIVNFFLSPSELSQYQIILTAFLMLQSIAGVIFHPFSKHIYRSDETVLLKFRKILNRAGIPIALLGGWAVWYFLENFTKVHFDAPIYMILALAISAQYFYITDIYKNYKQKQEKITMYITFTGVLINLSLTLILTNIYGIFGTVTGVCITNWIIFFIYKIRAIYVRQNTNK